MTTQKVVFISACVSISVAILSAILNYFLTKRRERQQKVWQYDLEKVRGIEELAGRITELLGSSYAYVSKLDVFRSLNSQFEDNMGALLRHKNLNQTMRDFQNAAYRVLDSLSHHEDPRPDLGDVQKSFDELSSACDLVLKGKGK